MTSPRQVRRPDDVDHRGVGRHREEDGRLVRAGRYRGAPPPDRPWQGRGVLPFTQVDVFTDELGLGNPVAVVHDADGLTEEQMGRFARWTNLSETTFLLRPDDPAADYRLRIFTTARELPFAGHPTLGSARAWLHAGGTPRAEGTVVQECGAGLVRVRVGPGSVGPGSVGARLSFAAPPVLRGGPVDPEDLAVITRALGVDVDDVVDASWADNGPGWVAVLLRDAATVLALEPDLRALRPFNTGVVGPCPPGSDVALELRAFIPDVSAGEDPVTGSLNASVAQWLIGTGRAPGSYTASQGTRLGRRGRVHVEQVGDDVWVGGATVVGIRGVVEL